MWQLEFHVEQAATKLRVRSTLHWLLDPRWLFNFFSKFLGFKPVVVQQDFMFQELIYFSLLFEAGYSVLGGTGEDLNGGSKLIAGHLNFKQLIPICL